MMGLEILRTRSGAGARSRRYRPVVDAIESRLLLSTIMVTTTDDNGPGSLRQAINMADKAGGTNTIDFDIPGSGPQVIIPQSELPPITSPRSLTDTPSLALAPTHPPPPITRSRSS